MKNNPLVASGGQKAAADLLNTQQRPVGAAPRKGRLTFALDATASRQPTWDMATKLQANMFASAASFGGLELQLVYYRGMNECQASRWVTQSGDLTKMMEKITCHAGSTQIARILRYVRDSAKKTDALVFVGDAMEEDHSALVDIAAQLGAKQIPCFMFQEGIASEVSHTFEMVAMASGGAFLSFDSASADRLKQLLGAVAAYASGGRAALLAYEEAQKKLGAPQLKLSDQMGKRK